MPTYIDEDGNPVDPSDLNQYEIIGEAAAPEQPQIDKPWYQDVGDVAWNFAAKAGFPVLQAASGAYGAVEDALGTGTDIGQTAFNTFQDVGQQINKDTGFQPGSLSERVWDIGTGLTPYLLAGPMLGATGTALSMGATGAGNKYGELGQIDPYASGFSKAVGAGAQGVADTVVGKFAASPLFNSELSYLGKLFKSGLGNVLGGQGSEITSMAVNSAVAGEVPEDPEARLLDRAVNDTIGAGLATTITHPMMRRQGAYVDDGVVKDNDARAFGKEIEGTSPEVEAADPTTKSFIDDAQAKLAERKAQIEAEQSRSLIDEGVERVRTNVEAQRVKNGAIKTSEAGVVESVGKDLQVKFGGVGDSFGRPPRTGDFQAELDKSRVVPIETESGQLLDQSGNPLYKDVISGKESPLPTDVVTTIEDPSISPKESSAVVDTQIQEKQNKRLSERLRERDTQREILANKAKLEPVRIIGQQPASPKEARLVLPRSMEIADSQLKLFQEDPVRASVSNIADNLFEPIDTTKGGVRKIILDDNTHKPGEVVTLNGEDIRPSLERAKAARSQATKIAKGILGNQRGAIKNPFYKEDVPVKRLPKEERFLENPVNKYMVLPRTLAELDPRFAPAYKAWEESQAHTNKTTVDIVESARPYLDLIDSRKVDLFLQSQRLRSANPAREGKALPESPEFLKSKGFSDEEVAAISSVRNWANTTLGRWKTILLNEAPFKAKEISSKTGANYDTVLQGLEERIGKWYDEKQQEKYVPFNRYGDWFITGKSPEGTLVRQHFYTKKQAKNGYLKLKAQGYDLEPVDKVRRPAVSGLDNMPADLADDLSFLFGGEGSVFGARKHLAKAYMVEGYDKNFKRSIAEYSFGLAKLEGRKIAKAGMEKTLGSLDNVKDKAMVEYAKQYMDDVLGGGKGSKLLSESMFHMYLGLNPKSAVVNLTQPVTVTLPYLATLDGWGSASKVMAKTVPQTFQYLSDPNGFLKKNPSAYAALELAKSRGIVNNAKMDDLYQTISDSPKSIQTLKQISTYMFSATENINRVHSFLAGFERAKAKGLSSTDAQLAAEAFVKDTQFSYGVGDKPQVARSSDLGATSFIFRLWQANWLRSVIGAARRGAAKSPSTMGAVIGATSAAITMSLPLIAMAGYKGMPAIGLIDKALQSQGEDPTIAIRQKLTDLGGEKLADAVIYGVPAPFLGTSFSGSLGLGNLVPNLEGGLVDAIGRLVMGVAADIPIRAGRFVDAAKVGKYGRAIEAILPEGLRNPVKAIRERSEGVTTLRGGQAVAPENLSWYDTALSAAGFPLLKTNKAYEIQNYGMALQRSASEKSRVAGVMFRDAMRGGDMDAANNIVFTLAEDLGIGPSDARARLMDSLKTETIKRANPTYGQSKEIPKGKARDAYLEASSYYSRSGS